MASFCNTKFWTLCLTVVLCFSLITLSASAEESMSIPLDYESCNSDESLIAPCGTGQGTIIYPTNDQFTISMGSVDTVKYTCTYGLFGKSGLVALRFTNIATGDFKSYDFLCDNNYHIATLPYTLPAGTYKVTLVNSTARNFNNISINFS